MSIADGGFERGLKAAFMEAMNTPPVPARHRTPEEYTRALEFALSMNWGGPMANHAGRWFTLQGEEERMCRYTHVTGRHRCKDMKP